MLIDGVPLVTDEKLASGTVVRETGRVRLLSEGDAGIVIGKGKANASSSGHERAAICARHCTIYSKEMT